MYCRVRFITEPLSGKLISQVLTHVSGYGYFWMYGCEMHSTLGCYKLVEYNLHAIS